MKPTLIPLDKVMERLSPSSIAVLEARKSGTSAPQVSAFTKQRVDELPTRVTHSHVRVDPAVELLKARGEPVTRESYLALIAPDQDWNDAEIEAQLPPELRWQD